MSLKRRTWLTLGAVVLGGAGAVTVAIAAPSDDGKEARPSKVSTIALQGTGNSRRELPRTDTEAFSLLGVTWQGAKAQPKGDAQIRTRSSETGKWSDWQELHLETHLPEDVKPQMRGQSSPLWVGPSDAVEAKVVAADGSTTALPKGLRLDLVDPGVTKREAAAASGEKTFAAAPAATSGNKTLAAAPVAASSEIPSAPASAGASEPAPAESAPDVLPSSETTAPSGDPSTSTPPSGTASPTETASPTPTVPPAPPSTVTQPPVVSRAAWGADESRVDDPPTYIDKVSAVFVHHTVGTNSYSCVDSPSMMRGILAYHTEPHNGEEAYNDIGYNFLVDKCGNIFEGRAGGIDKPVLGAHTYGFNSYSTSVALLGDFKNGGKPTKAALEATARVAAYKLGQYGGNPTGKVTLTAKGNTGVWDEGEQATLNTISGHRDGFNTECPGNALYTKLPSIRSYAASPGANSAAATADINRDGVTDLVAGTPQVSDGAGALTVVPGGTDGPVAAAKLTLTQSSPGVPGSAEPGDNFGASSAHGDVNGDGYADLVVGTPGEDDTSGHADRGAVTVLNGPGLDSGFTSVIGDGLPYTGAKLGSAVAAGDFDADGKADLFAAGAGTGASGLWWARHSGTDGTIEGTVASGEISHTDATADDFNRDGYADVALTYRDAGGTGRVTWFKGDASGLDRVATLSTKGGRSVASGDLNGDGYADLVIGQPYTAESGAYAGGQVTVLPGSANGPTTTGSRTVHQATIGVPGAAEAGDAMGTSVSVGDYDLDGYADVLTGLAGEDITRDGTARKDAGTALLLSGSASGLTGSGAFSYYQDTSGITGATESGDRLGSSVVLQDLSGWGRADLALGVDGEDSGDGTILQLDSGSSGVSTTGALYYGRTALGTPAGARLGQALAP